MSVNEEKDSMRIALRKIKDSYILKFNNEQDFTDFFQAVVKLRQGQKITGSLPGNLPSVSKKTPMKRDYGKKVLKMERKKLKFTDTSPKTKEPKFSISTPTMKVSESFDGFETDSETEDITELLTIKEEKPKYNALSKLNYNEKKRRAILQTVKEEEKEENEENEFTKEKLKQAAKGCQSIGSAFKLNKTKSYYEKPSLPGGLANRGNFCYLNAVLQVLLRQNKVQEFLLNAQKVEHKTKNVVENLENKENKQDNLQKEQSLSEFLQSIIKYFNEEKETERCFDATKIVNFICKLGIGKHFKSIEQQDSFEFLQYFLDVLEKEYGVEDINKLFGYKYCTTRTCNSCNAETKSTMETTNLSVPITKVTTVPGLLKQTLTAEEIELKCEKCCNLTKANSETEFKTLPTILLLHLNRFLQTETGIKKNETEVEIVKEFEFNECKYSLCGFVQHFGTSVYSGHYTSFVKTKDKVLSASDEFVSEVHLNKTLQKLDSKKNCYILFYEKMNL